MPYTNISIEYETWSEVAGYRFGIILSWFPSELSPRKYSLCNYQFQRNSTMEYTSTMVVFRDGVAEDNFSTQVWSHNKMLEPNFGKIEGQNNGSLVVSFHHVPVHL